MKPEEICGNRAIRNISTNPGGDIIFDADGQPALIRMQNDRGPMEVLVTADRKEEMVPLLLGNRPISITGFFFGGAVVITQTEAAILFGASFCFPQRLPT